MNISENGNLKKKIKSAITFIVYIALMFCSPFLSSLYHVFLSFCLSCLYFSLDLCPCLYSSSSSCLFCHLSHLSCHDPGLYIGRNEISSGNQINKCNIINLVILVCVFPEFYTLFFSNSIFQCHEYHRVFPDEKNTIYFYIHKLFTSKKIFLNTKYYQKEHLNVYD